MNDTKEIFTMVLPTGHTLTLRHGDITGEGVNAIVNVANVGLIHGGGVAGAIMRRGGPTIQAESLRVRRPRTGEAAVTGAGTLPCQYVIHAVGPVWRGHSVEENDRLLRSATVAALEIAREKKLDSIAFPAVSSGIFGFPKERCARVMIEAVCWWAGQFPGDGPRDLRFTIIDNLTVGLFADALNDRFGVSSDSAA